MSRLAQISALAGLVTVLGFIGCSSSSAEPEASDATMSQASENDNAITLYDRRIARAAADYRSLVAYAQQPEERVDEGTVARRFHQLAAEFQSILGENPKQVEAHILYGKLLDFFGDRDGAKEQFASALHLNPDIAVVNQYMGTYHAEEGDFAQALAYYLRATELAPKEAVYFYSLGELLYTYRPGILEAGILSADQLDVEMFEAFRRAAQLAPERLDLQFRYGESFYDRPDPDWEAALAHWKRMQDRNDLTPLQSDAIRLHRARVLGELHRYQEARDAANLVVQEGLIQSRDNLIEAINDAEAREQNGGEDPSEPTEPAEEAK